MKALLTVATLGARERFRPNGACVGKYAGGREDRDGSRCRRRTVHKGGGGRNRESVRRRDVDRLSIGPVVILGLGGVDMLVEGQGRLRLPGRIKKSSKSREIGCGVELGVETTVLRVEWRSRGVEGDRSGKGTRGILRRVGIVARLRREGKLGWRGERLGVFTENRESNDRDRWSQGEKRRGTPI